MCYSSISQVDYFWANMFKIAKIVAVLLQHLQNVVVSSGISAWQLIKRVPHAQLSFGGAYWSCTSCTAILLRSILVMWVKCWFMDIVIDGSNPRCVSMLCP